MEFSKIIKKIRKDNNLTQEELAEKLSISRQAVSNWETDKNLPDIELIIEISKTFSISLDELILGGKEMKKMEEKLINDGSDNKRAKMFMINNIIGMVFCILGLISIILKGLTVEYIDESGILHENFFLIPIGFSLIVIGIIIVIIGLTFYYKKTNTKKYISTKFGSILSFLSIMITLLIYSNSNKISIISIISTLLGILLVVFGILKSNK